MARRPRRRTGAERCLRRTRTSKDVRSHRTQRARHVRGAHGLPRPTTTETRPSRQARPRGRSAARPRRRRARLDRVADGLTRDDTFEPVGQAADAVTTPAVEPPAQRTETRIRAGATGCSPAGLSLVRIAAANRCCDSTPAAKRSSPRTRAAHAKTNSPPRRIAGVAAGNHVRLDVPCRT